MRRIARGSLLPVFFGAVIAAGCTAVISERADDAADGSGSGSGAFPSENDSAFTDKPWALVEQCNPAGPQDPGPAALQRVSNLEYDNMIRDLQANAGLPDSGLSSPSSPVSATPGPVTSMHVTGYVSAAETVAHQVVAPNVATFAGCTTEDAACGEQFVENFGKLVFRRPLTDTEVTRYVALVSDGLTHEGFATGIDMAAQALLNSADFLYKPELGEPAGNGTSKLSDYEVASRLSFYLWGSLPDTELLAAADAGQLGDATSVASQAERMLAVKAKSEPAVLEFFRDWLELRSVGSVTKDATTFPKWNPDLALAMQSEAELFSTELFWQGLSIADLFLANQSFMNKPLADFYGLSGPTGSDFALTNLDGVRRFGLLTQGAFLAREGKPANTAPTGRGKFVQMKLLCGTISPPPPGVEAKFPQISPDATQRERFSQHSTDAACAGCHQYMDPIGLVFENYDGIGDWRDLDARGNAFDVSGELIGTKDVDGPYNGVHELSEKLAQSADTRACVAANWFSHARQRELTNADACSFKTLLDGFSSQGFKLNSLAVEMTKTDAFRFRRTVQGGS